MPCPMPFRHRRVEPPEKQPRPFLNATRRMPCSAADGAAPHLRSFQTTAMHDDVELTSPQQEAHDAGRSLSPWGSLFAQPRQRNQACKISNRSSVVFLHSAHISASALTWRWTSLSLFHHFSLSFAGHFRETAGELAVLPVASRLKRGQPSLLYCSIPSRDEMAALGLVVFVREKRH